MEWIRGKIIGRGSFGTVNLAKPINDLQNLTPIVVKSSEIPNSISLKHEKQILSQLGNQHPNIIQFLGDSFSIESNTQFYNLFLEYAPNGSLSDHLRKSKGNFEISNVKIYTKSILEGLCYIHQEGFVHCDIKLQNILLFNKKEVKIADFGLAKRGLEKTGCQLRGTPLYMSPEIVAGGEVESPADIWALGCAVIEMITGKPAWNISPESDVTALLYKIGIAGESPVFPGNLCLNGKDFLEKCFVKDPNQRWTAQMLLDHPFLSGFEDDLIGFESDSPKCPFEFHDWESNSSSASNSTSELSGSLNWAGLREEYENSGRSSVSNRVEQLVNDGDVLHWTDEEAWVIVR